MTQLKKQLCAQRELQWNPPKAKFKTLYEEYHERVTKVYGKTATTPKGKRDIAVMFKKYKENDYHAMYLAVCKKFKVPQTKILTRYEVPHGAGLQSFQFPIDSTRSVYWEYRKRLTDLYTRFGQLDKARNVDLELLEYREKEHFLYRQRCFDYGEHPLPLYKCSEGVNERPKPVLMIDDMEIQVLGLTVLSLLVTYVNRHDISVELRRIGERGLDHPYILVDLASRQFLATFQETQRRMDVVERAKKHKEMVEYYGDLLKRLFQQYDARRLKTLDSLFAGIEQGKARDVYVKYCKELYVDPDEFEDQSFSEDEDMSSEEQDEEND